VPLGNKQAFCLTKTYNRMSAGIYRWSIILADTRSAYRKNL
jgi:hypothetical protein